MERSYITDPNHGGKVSCHRCGCFVIEDDCKIYWDNLHETILAYFHLDCFNPYEHYYGLDKPID